MEFEWDLRKAAANYRKHGIRFSDAVGVLYDDRALTILDSDAVEERIVTIGRDFLGRVVVVVYTMRGDAARIISARKGTRHERDDYRA